jgi:hypothetical protein
MFGANKYSSLLKHPGYNFDLGGAVGGIVGGLLSGKGASDAAEASKEAAEIQAKAQKEAAQMAALGGMPWTVTGSPFGTASYNLSDYYAKMLGLPANGSKVAGSSSSGTTNTTGNTGGGGYYVDINGNVAYFPKGVGENHINGDAVYTKNDLGLPKWSPIDGLGGNGTSGTYNGNIPGLFNNVNLQPSAEVLNMIAQSGGMWGKSAGMFDSLLNQTYEGGVGNYYDLLSRISQEDMNKMYSRADDAAVKGGTYGIANASGESPWMRAAMQADTRSQLERLLQADSMYQGALGSIGNLQSGLFNQYIGAMHLPEEPAKFGLEMARGTGAGASSAANYLANAGQSLAAGAAAQGNSKAGFWGGLADTVPNAINQSFNPSSANYSLFGTPGALPQYNSGNWWNPTGFNTGVGGSGYMSNGMGQEQMDMLNAQW